MSWEKLEFEEIKTEVFSALNENQSYYKDHIFGIPGTHLDSKIFPETEPFLKHAPFIRSLVENPNHIGVHTLKTHMEHWSGTQKLERDVLKMCAEDIFKASPNSYDGYIATGGTEANLQAMWMYRNLYIKTDQVKPADIVVFYSEDCHYSMSKGANLLGITEHILKVDVDAREINQNQFRKDIHTHVSKGRKHFIMILNMGTTMFGSVDELEPVVDIFNEFDVYYKVHIDAAFGGFIYPFTNPKYTLHFGNLEVSSISVDAHKMLQAPYGTGVFLCRKGLLKYVENDDAGYIDGFDHTICGSRSGANAVSVWMILKVHGYQGLKRRMEELWERTNYLESKLNDLRIKFYRDPSMNIITIHSEYIPEYIARDFVLVPETHTEVNKWWKIVVMEHVSYALIDNFIGQVKDELKKVIAIS